MTEKEQLIIELRRLGELLYPNAQRDEYAVFLKIERILQLLDSRITDLERS